MIAVASAADDTLDDGQQSTPASPDPEDDDQGDTPQVSDGKLQNILDNLYRGAKNPRREEPDILRTRYARKFELVKSFMENLISSRVENPSVH